MWQPDLWLAEIEATAAVDVKRWQEIKKASGKGSFFV